MSYFGYGGGTSNGVDVINISIHDDDDFPLFENAVRSNGLIFSNEKWAYLFLVRAAGNTCRSEILNPEQWNSLSHNRHCRPVRTTDRWFGGTLTLGNGLRILG